MLLTPIAKALAFASRNTARQFSRTVPASNEIFRQFFDDEANFGKSELRPKKRPGRAWTEDELRLKSNSDLHKLWYVCLKERNMLMTMRNAYVEHARSMPNPERIDRVNETMKNIQTVVHERNDAFYRLETGESADPPTRTVTSFMGFTYKKQAEEHLEPPNESNKEYEVPYLDGDAYMMQKLWKEKEFMKERDRKDIENHRKVVTDEMRRFRKGGPRGNTMELNVKQSGIVDRLRTVERYLRDDLSCGLHSCKLCAPLALNNLGSKPNKDENSIVPGNHVLIVDTEVLIRFIDIFDSDLFKNVIITQNVWEYIKQKSVPTYKKLNKFVYEDKDPRFSVFMSEFHHKTFVRQEEGLSDSLRREKVLYVCANYLKDHWAKYNVVPVILCAEDDVLARLKDNYELSFSVKQYVEGMQNAKKRDLLDSMAAYDSSSAGGKIIYENYLSHDEITQGIARGIIKKGTFSVSRENYREAYVLVDPSTMTSWFIQGLNCNRAIDGDVVAVQLLPEEEWTLPEKKVCLRDVEDLEMKADDEAEEETTEEETPKAKRAKFTPIPTAKVVGIMKRNWRPYCGIIMRSQLKNARRHLFCPSDRLIPRTRIETEQVDILESQRIVVSIDQWPRDSRYPLGHYVRALGKIGDREIENEVLLLEHDIPHAPFSDAVMECLPGEDWQPDLQPPRVDPLGCTDIDDALHCRPLDNGFLEVGVHIADVTHFVRSGTAIDEEAASRGTTVYLCDRRIDMLPALLSSNLCSLRGGEERYAFSVIWTMTSDAEILDTKYHKSLICSKAALTYEQAQEFIDDPNL
ncbi:RNB-like protein, partial [Ancylostoma duodenale]